MGNDEFVNSVKGLRNKADTLAFLNEGHGLYSSSGWRVSSGASLKSSVIRDIEDILNVESPSFSRLLMEVLIGGERRTRVWHVLVAEGVVSVSAAEIVAAVGAMVVPPTYLVS